MEVQPPYSSKLLKSENLRRTVVKENRGIVEYLYSREKIGNIVKEHIQFIYDYKNAGTKLIDLISFDLLKMGIKETAN